MATIRYRDRDRSAAGTVYVAVGALAGLAAGVLLAQRYGGLSGLGARVRDRVAAARGEERDGDQRPTGHDVPEYDDEPLTAAGARDDDQGDDEMDEGEELEERVLEAFRNDPVLSERAVDIGAVGSAVIELSGWVHSEEESHHAVTVTRGVPGIDTVVNRLEVRDEASRMADSARRYASGESETSPRWEGMGVGTGRPRQGVSTDGARHADPRTELEDRWQSQQQSVRAAADDMENLAERRQRTSANVQGDETGGSPIAPSGVPKGDHVADPASAEPFLREQTGRVDPNLRAQ
jgi:hypothetical protein